jgi:hypothetical protein
MRSVYGEAKATICKEVRPSAQTSLVGDVWSFLWKCSSLFMWRHECKMALSCWQMAMFDFKFFEMVCAQLNHTGLSCARSLRASKFHLGDQRGHRCQVCWSLSGWSFRRDTQANLVMGLLVKKTGRKPASKAQGDMPGGQNRTSQRHLIQAAHRYQGMAEKTGRY